MGSSYSNSLAGDLASMPRTTPLEKSQSSALTIGFQSNQLPYFPTPVELLLVFQGSLEAPVDESFVDDLPELGTKLASPEHFQGISVHGFKMMNDSIGRLRNIFWSSLSDLHSFPHVAQIQSLGKELFSHGALQCLKRRGRKSIPLDWRRHHPYIPACRKPQGLIFSLP